MGRSPLFLFKDCFQTDVFGVPPFEFFVGLKELVFEKQGNRRRNAVVNVA